MLTLESPFYEIDDIIVYRDHAVPNQFYYAAPPPKVSRSDGRFMFDLLAYTVELEHSPLSGTTIPDELGAGFLTMGVDCALSDTQRRGLSRDLANRIEIPEEQIALYPIPYHKGSVRVLALDQFTEPGEPPGDVNSSDRLKGRPTFVEAIIGSATPSLMGDLRAIFSLSLSQEGVAFLQGLYEDGAAPVGVVYELNFYGLRPAIEVTITADLSRIYQHFGGGLSGQYRWFKAEVNAGLDYLEEQGDIKVNITSQATGEEAQKSKELALSLFKDRIVREMFRPTTPPQQVGATGDLVSGLAGATAGGNISLKLDFKRAEELKTVTYDFRERAPEERTHAPQGFLPLLLDETEVQDRIHLVPLDHPFFERLEVLVTGPTQEEFEVLQIRQVEATLTYGEPADAVAPESRTLLFRPDNTGDKTFAVPRRGRESLAYRCALRYEFQRTSGVDTDAFFYEVPARTQTRRTLLINPYADFGVLNVQVEPGRIHSDVREVDVHLTYRAPDERFEADEHLRLVVDGPEEAGQEHRWQVRTQETDIVTYDATYTFIFQDGTAFTAPPQTLSEPLLRVDSPFAGERRLLISPNVLSEQINRIIVELEYNDEENNYQRKFLVNLEPIVADGATRWASTEITWPVLDLNHQRVRYRATTLEPGFEDEGDWEEEDGPGIIVGAVGSRTKTVDVQLIGPSLTDVGIDALLLKFELAVPDVASGETHSVLLQGDMNITEVKMTLPPGVDLRYRYQTIVFKGAQREESEWKDATDTLLVISTHTL